MVCIKVLLFFLAVLVDKITFVTGASFSEYFYGLKRVPVDENIAEMTEKQKDLSLIFLVYVPYLMIKLKKKLATYRLELADGVLVNVNMFFSG